MPGTSWSEGGAVEPQKSWVLLLREGAEAGQPKPNITPAHGPHAAHFTQLCVCVCVLGVGTVCTPGFALSWALGRSCCDLAGGGGGLAGMWVRNSRGKGGNMGRRPPRNCATGSPSWCLRPPVQDLGEGSQNTQAFPVCLGHLVKLLTATDLLIKKTTSPLPHL